MGYITSSGIYVPKINKNTQKAKDLLNDVYSYLWHTDLNYDDIPIGKEKDLYEGTKDFFTGKIKFPEVRILTKDIDDFAIQHDLLFSTDEFEPYIKANTKKGTVYDIPLEYTRSPKFSGGIYTYLTLSTNFPILYQNIIIQNPSYLMASCFYAHELGHIITGLLEALEDPINKEILSIFFEKVKALNTSSEIFAIVQRDRLIHLLNNLITMADSIADDEDILDYLISLLKAEALFDLYYHSSEADKTRILILINEIAAGNLSIEKLLALMELSDIDKLDINPIKRNLQIK